MSVQSAVEFAGNSRIHIALAVSDLERSRKFYETLLGVAPVKLRPGYVKFEPQDPSVNLSLNEVVVEPSGSGKSVSHFGVQVKSTDAVQSAITRLEAAGHATRVEENSTCCYAVQDKVWVADPDGNQWEVFVVTTADAEQRKAEASACCEKTPATSSESSCC